VVVQRPFCDPGALDDLLDRRRCEASLGEQLAGSVERDLREARASSLVNVLDMGCGAAATSLFLALECDFEAWAADLWIDPTDNLARVRQAGLDRRVSTSG